MNWRYILVAILLVVLSHNSTSRALANEDPPAVWPPPSVLIGELAWAGSSVSSADEWLELRSTALELIDLSGWSVWDTATDEATELVRINEGQIAPGGTFLVSNNAPDHEFSDGSSVLLVEPDLITRSLSLSNSRLQLELRDETGAVVDVAGSGGAGFLRDPLVSRSMVRQIDPVQPGTTKEAWFLADDQSGFDIGTPDFGSPTPSGRPSLQIPDACTFVQDAEGKEHGIAVRATDPNSDILTVSAEVAGTIVLSEATATQGEAITIAVPSQVSAGPIVLTLLVRDEQGLFRTVALDCQRLKENRSIVISEVFASPDKHHTEFIELTNSSDRPVELYGWQLDDRDDGGSRPFRIDYQLQLDPGAYVAFFGDETGLALNNTGDDIQLLLPSGQRLDLVRYTSNQTELSWNRGVPWYWTSTSPGRANHSQPELVLPGQGGIAAATPIKQITVLSLQELLNQRSLLTGHRVQTGITIAVDQGRYDDRRLLAADGEAFVELQLPEGERLSVVAGERVNVLATVSRSAVPRLLVESKADVVSLGKGERPVLVLDELDEPHELQLVSFVGDVTETGVALSIQTNRYQFGLTRARGIDLPDVVVGDVVTATGVVVSVDPLRIRVIDEADVVVSPPIDTVVTPAIDTDTHVELSDQVVAVRVQERAEPSVTTASDSTEHIGSWVEALSAVLGARSDQFQEVAKRMQPRQPPASFPEPVLPIIVTAVAALGFLALWGDLLLQYLHRRIQND